MNRKEMQVGAKAMQITARQALKDFSGAGLSFEDIVVRQIFFRNGVKIKIGEIGLKELDEKEDIALANYKDLLKAS